MGDAHATWNERAGGDCPGAMHGLEEAPGGDVTESECAGLRVLLHSQVHRKRAREHQELPLTGLIKEDGGVLGVVLLLTGEDGLEELVGVLVVGQQSVGLRLRQPQDVQLPNHRHLPVLVSRQHVNLGSRLRLSDVFLPRDCCHHLPVECSKADRGSRSEGASDKAGLICLDRPDNSHSCIFENGSLQMRDRLESANFPSLRGRGGWPREGGAAGEAQ
mmetsp:Transcript_22490/g.31289  ORF Transcript_22490/g.31289 Transcript_22490/m.31289 type:complete len:218 (-) Transcript_22490:181-834(-)